MFSGCSTPAFIVKYPFVYKSITKLMWNRNVNLSSRCNQNWKVKKIYLTYRISKGEKYLLVNKITVYKLTFERLVDANTAS